MRIEVYFNNEEYEFIKTQDKGFVRSLIQEAMAGNKRMDEHTERVLKQLNIPKSEMRGYKEPLWKDKKKKTL